MRYYMYELFKALDYAHSKGIIHRDVKSGNIMVDHKKKQLRLIDWGLADYYYPNKKLNIKVGAK